MGFKVNPKHFKKAWKVAAPVALTAASIAFPQVKAVQVATVVGKALL